MRIKSLFIVFLCLLMPLTASAKHRKKHKEKRVYVSAANVQYRFNGTVGWLNRDEKIVGKSNITGFTMDRPVVLGGTFAIEFLPTYENIAQRQWNNTSIGLAVTALDLGQKEYLGQAIALYPYLNIPLVNKPHFVLGLRPGMGMSFVTKTYANTVPEELKWQAYTVRTSTNPDHYQLVANTSVGSIVNAWITAGMYMDIPLKKGWTINFAAGWQHISNGSIMTPNAGYNMANAELGITYRPGKYYSYYEPRPLVPRGLYDGVDKKWAVELGVAGGCRSVYYRDQDWFGVGSISLAAYWKPVSIFRLGGGLDFYYDGAYIAVNDEYREANPDAHITYFGKTYLKESNSANCYRLGISIQPEMVLGKFSIGYHMGIYLLDPVKNLEPRNEAEKADKAGTPLKRGIFYKYDPTKASTYEDGWFYQKLQLKYLCTKHMYVQIGLKLHIMKAEFIDAGLGIRI